MEEADTREPGVNTKGGGLCRGFGDGGCSDMRGRSQKREASRVRKPRTELGSHRELATKKH